MFLLKLIVILLKLQWLTNFQNNYINKLKNNQLYNSLDKMISFLKYNRLNSMVPTFHFTRWLYANKGDKINFINNVDVAPVKQPKLKIWLVGTSGLQKHGFNFFVFKYKFSVRYLNIIMKKKNEDFCHKVAEKIENLSVYLPMVNYFFILSEGNPFMCKPPE